MLAQGNQDFPDAFLLRTVLRQVGVIIRSSPGSDKDVVERSPGSEPPSWLVPTRPAGVGQHTGFIREPNVGRAEKYISE